MSLTHVLSVPNQMILMVSVTLPIYYNLQTRPSKNLPESDLIFNWQIHRIFFSLHAPDYSSISALFLIRVTFVSGCRMWVIMLFNVLRRLIATKIPLISILPALGNR